MVDKSPKPWLQQDGESVKAYKGFTLYRDQGIGRSRERAYEMYAGLGPNTRKNGDLPPYFGKWSKMWNWLERARAYDVYMMELQREAEERAVEDSSCSSSSA
jgi:hypothetical protein